MSEKNSADDLNAIRWKCRRGLLELDVLLDRFVTHHYLKLNLAQRQIFSRLLEESDPVLLSWLMRHSESEDKDLQEMVNMILNLLY